MRDGRKKQIPPLRLRSGYGMTNNHCYGMTMNHLCGMTTKKMQGRIRRERGWARRARWRSTGGWGLRRGRGWWRSGLDRPRRCEADSLPGRDWRRCAADLRRSAGGPCGGRQAGGETRSDLWAAAWAGRRALQRQGTGGRRSLHRGGGLRRRGGLAAGAGGWRWRRAAGRRGYDALRRALRPGARRLQRCGR